MRKKNRGEIDMTKETMTKKYKYTYQEWSQDTREFEIESDVKLTREEIQDISLGCTLTDGYTYQGGEKDKRFKATFIGTEFGDDTQTEISGDEMIEEDDDNEEDE
jgi:hypothetical protein